jgi:hypothetical protein
MKKTILISCALASTLLASCTQPPATTANSTPAQKTPPPISASSATPTAATPATPAATGPGEEVSLDEVGLKYTIPAGWIKQTPETLVSADQKLAIIFVTPPEGDAQAVLAQIAGNLDSKLKDVKVEGEATEHEINGISSYSLEGTGTTPEGQKMEWALELMVGIKPIILLEMAEEGAFDANEAAFAAFEESFEKVGGDTASATPAADASATPEESVTPEGAETP